MLMVTFSLVYQQWEGVQTSQMYTIHDQQQKNHKPVSYTRQIWPFLLLDIDTSLRVCKVQFILNWHWAKGTTWGLNQLFWHFS